MGVRLLVTEASVDDRATPAPDPAPPTSGICPKAAASLLAVPLATEVIFWPFMGTAVVGTANWSSRFARMMFSTFAVAASVGAG